MVLEDNIRYVNVDVILVLIVIMLESNESWIYDWLYVICLIYFVK